MSLRIPIWALAALGAVLLAAGTAGFAVEGRPWADTHPYAINLLSAATGFSASGLFAALVLDQARRRRYHDVEQDRRTQTVEDLRDLLNALVRCFGATAGGYAPEEALKQQAEAFARADADTVQAGTQRLAAALSGPCRGLLSPDGYPDGHKLASRFAFVADGRVDYLTDRLDRKSRDLRLLLAGVHEAPAAPENRHLSVVYAAAVDVASATVNLREWMYQAPSKAMREAVQQGAYRTGPPATGLPAAAGSEGVERDGATRE